MKETYRQEHVRCGKAGCKTCPHGPYWYAYWKAGGRLHKRYVGKRDPRLPQPEGKRIMPVTLQDCYRELGITDCTPFAAAQSSYRKLCLIHHPDRGGRCEDMQAICHAWDVVRKYNAW